MTTTIAGPKIQLPTSLTPISDESGALHPQWSSFFHSTQQTVFALTRSGPTASRPTSGLDGRWIGLPFYDTTLGKAINLHSVNPDVWHDAAGNVV